MTMGDRYKPLSDAATPIYMTPLSRRGREECKSLILVLLLYLGLVGVRAGSYTDRAPESQVAAGPGRHHAALMLKL